MDHTAVSATQASSVTLSIWKLGAKKNNSNFASSNSVVYTKTSKSQMGPSIYSVNDVKRFIDAKIGVQNRKTAVV